TLAVSENSVSEVLARLVAVADGQDPTFAGATRAVLARLAALGVPTDGVTLADTSGLLVENQVPTAVLADVMATALDPDRPDLRGAVTGLPVAALEGTLSTRMHNAAAGVLRAKTGTLLSAVSLTGLVLDADGRLLVFAVVADDLELGGVGPARAAIDEWAARVAACGCRGAPAASRRAAAEVAPAGAHASGVAGPDPLTPVYVCRTHICVSAEPLHALDEAILRFRVATQRPAYARA